MFMSKTIKRKGFTLIEILLVVGIIAILAGVVIVAINPARQLGQANNTQRWSNINTILNAVHQYAIDNQGALPASITTTETEICKTGGECTGLIDLDVLVPDFVVSIPFDPQCPAVCSGANGAGYTIAKDANNRVTVKAPDAQLGITVEVKR